MKYDDSFEYLTGPLFMTSARALLLGALTFALLSSAQSEPALKLAAAPVTNTPDPKVLLFRSISPLPNSRRAGEAKQLMVQFADGARPPMALDVQTLQFQALQSPAARFNRANPEPAPAELPLSSERVRSLWTNRSIMIAWLSFDGLSEALRIKLEARSPIPKSTRIQALTGDVYAEFDNLQKETGKLVLKTTAGKRISPEQPAPTDVEPLFHGAFIACVKAVQPSTPPIPTKAFGRRYDPARRCGLMNAEGRWLARPEFEFMEQTHGDGGSDGPFLLLLRGSEPCASTLHLPVVVTCLGQPIASLFAGGRLPFATENPDSARRGGGAIGYLSPEGNWTIPPAYAKAGPFNGAIATVEQQSIPGIIDRVGNWLTPAPPNPVAASWLLKRGIGRERIGGSGMIDYQGRMVIPFMYQSVGTIDGRYKVEACHQNGCDAVQLSKPSAHVPNAPILSTVNGQKRHDAAKWIPSAEDGVWGYKDGSDRWVLKPEFEEAEPFETGLGRVRSAGNWGVVTTDRKWLFKPDFVWIKPFSQGAALAEDKDGAQFLLHATGERIALDAKKVESDFAEDGLAVARDSASDRLGFIDRRGEWKIKPQFSFAQPFRDGYAVVSGYLPENWRPENFVEPPFVVRSLHWLSPTVVAVRANVGNQERFGLMDRNGRWLIPSH